MPPPPSGNMLEAGHLGEPIMPGQAKRVLILGHGAMGHAFESLLRGNHEVAVWDRDLDTWQETQPLEDAAHDRDIVIFALPTNPHDELAGRLAACMQAGRTLCLSIAKGLDAQGRTPAQIFEHHFSHNIGWALLYGPMLARELQAGLPGFAMVASADRAVAGECAALFQGTQLHLEPLDDPHGAAWAAIMKNVYVPLIGAADALALGDNLRGCLITEMLREMSAILERMGGHASTAYTLAGLGDLVTSSTGASSHHRRIGAELAEGRTGHLSASGANIRTEGVHTLEMVRAHRPFDPEQFALFDLICQFIDEPATLKRRLADYLDHRFRREALPR